MASTTRKAQRSVSFGDVEEQIYDNSGAVDDDYYHDNDNDHDDNDNDNDNGDYYDEDGGEGEQQQPQHYHDHDDEQIEDGDEDEGNASNSGKKEDSSLAKSKARNNNNNTTNTATRLTSSSSLICPNCGSKDIEQHDASGASICTECGVVVEENAIVSAVEFVEGSGGSSSMVGQFVSATSSKAYTGGGGGGAGGPAMRGGRYGFSKDSRETTLANGRRRIQDVASRLRLGSHYVDAAHRLFTVAVEKNFVQGRRTTHVVAATLYIACRMEKSQHMLIDFSDALQVNVYTLGTTFLKFRRLLGLKLEIIDPALYVYRFAAHLDLDDKANAVALTALRLVGRMKRDWIVAGRRPAGICAAALLIAARAHGFSKHHQDVTRILRVCGVTVTNRVKEFEQTPSAALTLHQFNSVELDSEADPPIYTKNKLLEARAKAIQENNVALLTSGALDDPMGGKRAARWRDLKRKSSDKNVKFQELYDSIAKEMMAPGQQKLLESGTNDNANDNELPGEDDHNKGGNENDDGDGDLNEQDDNNDKDSTKGSDNAASSENQIVLRSDAAGAVTNPEWSKAYPKSRGRKLVLADQATIEEMQKPSAPTEAKISLSEWKEEMPDEITEEIDSMFRSDEEIAQKEVIFNKINKDYLEQQERKENDRLTSEAAEKDQEQEAVSQAEGHIRYLKSNKGRKRKRGGDNAEGGEEELTTEEALLAAVSNRKISRKINYDAMSAIFDDDGTFATDAPQASEEGGDPMFGVV